MATPTKGFSDFKNCAIYLIGFPGVGKLSIAREICKRADFRLVDSHMINKLVFPFVRENRNGHLPPEVWEATRKIRKIALNTMVTVGNRDFNFVFTNSLIDGMPGDLKVFRLMSRSMKQRQGCLIPVRITCEEEEHRKRIVSPDREAELKLMDADRISQWRKTDEPLRPNHPHTIEIDVTPLSASESAAHILAMASPIYAEWLRANQQESAISKGN